MIPAASAAARAAGVVVAAGYLFGVADGPVTGVIGGLALITFGRALMLDRVHEGRFALALALLAGGLGVAVLRWGSLDLTAMRGAQAALGPTVLVGPQLAAAACIAAAGGAVVALGAWLEEGTLGRRIPIPETFLGAAALAAAFWGPAPRGFHLGDLAVTAAAIVVIAGLAGGAALALRRLGPRLIWAALAVAAGAVGAGAALIA